MTSGCGAIWSDAEKENSWSMNRNRKPENFLDPPNPPPPYDEKVALPFPPPPQIFVVQQCLCICTVYSIVRMLMVGGLLFSELDSALF